MGKESSCNAGDTGDAVSIPGSGRSPGGGLGNPHQYSKCLKSPTDREAWRKFTGWQRNGDTGVTEHRFCSKHILLKIMGFLISLKFLWALDFSTIICGK